MSRPRRIFPRLSPTTSEWADAIIFSTPTRFRNIASQMKQFPDMQGGLWAQGKTANKVVSAMSSAQNPHGGQEATILSIYIDVPLGSDRSGARLYGPGGLSGPEGILTERA